MPIGSPQICELWETTEPFSGRIARALVAEVASNVITFVSLTGNRIRVPSSRIGDEESYLRDSSEWRFIQSPPTHAMNCSRSGCRLPGILRIDRESTPEWICPRHMPASTNATLDMSEHPGATNVLTSETLPCPVCQADTIPTDNMRRSSSNTTYGIWECPQCKYQLGAATLLLQLPAEHRLAGLQSLHSLVQTLGLQARRIDMTPAFWSDLYSRHESDVISGAHGARMFRGTPVHVAPGHDSRFSVVIQTRDIGRRTSLPVPRLGGQPGRPNASPTPVMLRDLYGPPEPPPQRPARAPEPAPAEAPPEPSKPEPTGFPTGGSLWVQRKSGDLVEVVKRLGENESVVFRRVVSDSDIPQSMSTMPYHDFMTTHRAWSKKDNIEPPTVVPVSGEEWENKNDLTLVEILHVDVARELVQVLESKSRRTRTNLPLREFGSGQWRKITRRTSFDHLMDDDL